MRSFFRICVLVAAASLVACGGPSPTAEEPASGPSLVVAPEAVRASDPAAVAAGCVSSPTGEYPTDSSGIELKAWPPCDNGPADANGGDTGLDQVQAAFDFFSWRTFVALNWPPAGAGVPDESATIGADGDNATVWETWKESYEVFKADGSKPAPWGSPRVPPEACRGVAGETLPVLQQVGKTPNVPNVLDEFSNPFKTGPVIDQTGQFARFEISLNEVMFDHIVDNELYSKAGQVKYADSDPPTRPTGLPAVIFPHGQNAENGDGDTPPKQPAVGAMMTKAAWMDLTDRPELHDQFHLKKALVYTPGEPGIEENCELRTMGLVGLHIAHKTCDAAQWIWSTFEHVANVPSQTEVDSGDFRRSRYNFYKPNCDDCEPVNEPPKKRPWNPNKGGPPSQIVRIDSIEEQDPNAVRTNGYFQGALKNVNGDSVWQNYELVSAQWPTQSDRANCAIKATLPEGVPAPQFLANTTLESYIQGHVPNVSSSCIECHNNATTTNSIHSDFTYLLERAK